MLSVKDMRENSFFYEDCKFISESDYQSLVRGDCKPLLNDILIAKDGSYLKYVFVIEEEKEEVILSSIGILRPNLDLINPFYIKYYLQSDFVKKQVARKYVSGTALPRIILKNFGEIQVPYIDIQKQQKIIKVLRCLDAKIELNQRINAELESMAKTLYDYWFVQFEFPTPSAPLSAPLSLSGHLPKYDRETLDNNKNTSVVFGGTEGGYKSAGGKMVWNEALNKKVPEGWQVKSLGKALKTNLGGTPSTKNPEYWENATIPWLNSGDLVEFPIIKSSSFVTKNGVDNSATTILPKGSVVISLVRYIRPSIIALEACANQSVVGIRESEELKNTFIYPYLVNEIPRLMSLRTGAQQPHINKETIDEILLCIPPENILNKYYKISEPIYKKIINLAFESQTLTELRDWLLPMLMNGQVRA